MPHKSNDLGEVLRKMKQRIEADVPPQDRKQLWSLTELLMGLKYKKAMMYIFQPGDLKDSVIYQDLLSEGRAEGIALGRGEGKAEEKAEGERSLLLRLGEKKFGAPNTKMRRMLEGITSLERLEELSLKLLDVNSWQELLN